MSSPGSVSYTHLINELKASGAEAITVNEQRVVAATEIRCAGPTISVNNTRVSPPYVVEAIGDAMALESALTVSYTHLGYIMAEARTLQGADIHLDFPSVGATENIMLAAVRAQGVTVIRNAAKEPEVVDLQNFLNKIGACIRGAGTDTIKVEGVDKLKPASHSIIPDRIEAGTFMVAAAMTGGHIRLENVIAEHTEPVAAKLREAGVTVDTVGGHIEVQSEGQLKAVDVKTLPLSLIHI